MKKNFTILLLLISTLAVVIPANAKQVNLADTEAIAMQVFKKALEADETSNKNDNAIISNSYTEKDGEVPLYTIYNFEPTGFVILSAEDNYNAVIAFSTDNNIDFATKETNPVYNTILKMHEQRIKYVKQYNLEATPEIKKEWAELKLLGNSNAKSILDFDVVVAPLTTTKWGQGEFYNQLLPQDEDADDDKDGRTNGGCVPVAMSQLIKFHNYPPSGNGNASYTDPQYGKLSADFCETNYNWNNMADELTDYNEDVAQVIQHMGYSTETHYSIDYTGTYSSRVRDAFVNHFGFDDSASWFNDVYNELPLVAREELDAGRPLIVSAGTTGSESRHCWVVDGYGYLTDASVTEAEYFHMNWGWAGKYNGWYLDNGTFWRPLEEENKDIRFIIDRRVIYKLFPAEEECQSPKTAYVSTVRDTRLYLYYSNRNLEETIQFRYRVQGDAAWTEFEPTEERYQYIRDLTPNTLYEYQVKRTCCDNVWSSFGPTEYFKTAPEDQSCLYVKKSNADDFYELVGYDMDEYNLYKVEYLQDGYDYIYGFRESCDSDAATSYYDCFGESVSVASIGDNVPYSTLNRNRNCTTTTPADCANNKGAFFFEECDNGDRFYFIETEDGTIYDPYFPDSLDIEFEEGTVVNFDFERATFGSPCSLATGGAIWFTCIEYNTDIDPNEGGDDEIFETYPFLNDLIDASNCTVEKIDVYDRGSYNYLEIEFADGEIQVYRDNGRRYCTNNPDRDYICIVKYGLTDEDIISSWACGGSAEEEEEEEEEQESDPTCIIDVQDNMRVTDRGSTSVYLYAPRPYDRSPNQFRYRAVGSTAWTLTDISDKHYKLATDLTGGVEYEFQLRYECSQDSWSAYSASFYFSFSNLVAKSEQILPPLSKLELSNLLKEDTIEIYPNPATNSILITGYRQIENEVELTITDLIGKVVFSNFYNSKDASISLNIESLPVGIYVTEIKQGDKHLIKKFIKR